MLKQDEDWIALYCVSEKLQNDKEVVLEVVKQDGGALEYAFLQLKNNEKIILEAIKQDKSVLKYVSNRL